MSSSSPCVELDVDDRRSSAARFSDGPTRPDASAGVTTRMYRGRELLKIGCGADVFVRARERSRAPCGRPRASGSDVMTPPDLRLGVDRHLCVALLSGKSHPCWTKKSTCSS